MGRLVRLACLRHAASVHPEPGSNSPIKFFIFCLLFSLASQIDVLLSFQRSFLFCCLSLQVAFLIYQTFLCLSTAFLLFLLTFLFDTFFSSSLFIFPNCSFNISSFLPLCQPLFWFLLYIKNASLYNISELLNFMPFFPNKNAEIYTYLFEYNKTT